MTTATLNPPLSLVDTEKAEGLSTLIRGAWQRAAEKIQPTLKKVWAFAGYVGAGLADMVPEQVSTTCWLVGTVVKGAVSKEPGAADGVAAAFAAGPGY